jgi:nicotinamide mononucleotide transporter
VEPSELDPIEILAAVLSLAGVWWTSVRNPICWPVGLASVLLYAWVFDVARLYSDALLQLVYAVLLVYGWWHWHRAARPGRPAGSAEAGAGAGRPPVAEPDLKVIGASLAAGVAGGLALGSYMALRTDAALPWLDAALAAASLVAQFWAARLYRLNWLLWIGVDVVYIFVYANRALPTTALLYAAFVVLAGIGWWKWRASAPAGT